MRVVRTEPSAGAVTVTVGATVSTVKVRVELRAICPEASDCVVNVKEGYLEKNQSKLETYLHVLDQAAKLRDADPEKALAQLQPIYQVPPAILAEGLKRQTPQPVLDSAAIQGLHKGVGYLIDLGYLKSDVIDSVFDSRVQDGASLGVA